MSDVLNPIEEAASRHANHLAILSSRGALSYREYYDQANYVAEHLQHLGLKERDLLAISMPVNDRYPVLLLACLQLGVVACPVNPKWPLKHQADVLAEFHVAAIVVEDVDRAREVFTDIPCFNLDLPFEETRGEPPLFIGFDEQQPATMLFTSGSMGANKAVLHSFYNHYYSARMSNRNLELNPGDRWLLSLPLFHVSGLGILFRCLLSGATIAVPDHDEAIDQAIERLNITHISVVPTQLYRLLQTQRGRNALAHLRGILLGGAPIPADLIRKSMAARLPIYTTYGLTETTSQVTATRPGETGATLYTAGRPHVVGSLRIVDDGEIQVRGDALFRGYVIGNRVELPLTSDGWFETGDLGSLDEHGNLHVHGRKDNMFISGGENIQPEEIEKELCEIDGIEQAIVVPVPDDEYGARPVAFLRTRDGVPMPGRIVKAVLAETLPGFKIPTAFLPWPQRSDLQVFKVNRKEMLNIALEQYAVH